MKTTTRKNRVFALILSAMLSVEQMALIMPVYSKADSSVSSKGIVAFPKPTGGNDTVSAELSHDDLLVDNLDGTYTFTSDLSAAYAYSDKSTSRLQLQDGYYTFDKAGKYLIELWGGDGGDGLEFLGTGKKGYGGDGGFVYGVLDIKPEDVNQKKLFYEIGSKGESRTWNVDGGGTDGTGGGAGNLTLISTGAGGGYSAAYLLDSDEEMSEAIRDDPDKVLMIAGGGGGGGAGTTGIKLSAWLLKMHADGGDGGSMESSIQATPYIGNFTQGIYYAGENGSSSGLSTAYVGEGGTDKPGELNQTFIGIIESTEAPNDWQRIYRPDSKRGNGGAGNLRGGGGGAGFAGGSGGLQNAPVDAGNIGGGGGGSSFVNTYSFTDQFTYMFDPTVTNIVPEGYFVDKSGNTNKSAGGAVVLRYLPPENDNSFDYLSDVTVTGKVSKYFDVVNVSVNGNGIEKPTADANGTPISITGSVMPQTSGLKKGETGTHLKYQITLRPKEGFLGGNSIPIFADDEFDIKSNTDSSKTGDIEYANDVSYVNIPMKVDYKTNNLTKGAGETYTADELKTTPTTYDSRNYLHDGISGIDYTVYDSSNAAFNTKTVADSDVGSTYSYNVKATMTSKNATPAKVGNAGTGIVNKTAKVKCLAEIPIHVDGFFAFAKKKLAYNNGSYDLDLDITIKNDDSKIFSGDIYYLKSHAQELAGHQAGSVAQGQTQTSYSYTVPADGWYYLQAWGGNGGKGGDSATKNGGSGGQGGYVSGYTFLKNGDRISYEVGSYGGGADDVLLDLSGDNRVGGFGGAYSQIKINDTTALIAGGGSGGNAALAVLKGLQYADGAAGLNASSNPTNSLSGLSAYNGKDGVHPSSKNENVSQAAGINYLNDELINAGDVSYTNIFGENITLAAPDVSGFASANASSKNGSGGEVKITRLASPSELANDKQNLTNRLGDFNVSEDFSKYFDVQEIHVDGTSIGSTDTSDISLALLGNKITISDTFSDSSEYSDSYYGKATTAPLAGDGITYNVKVKLTPKEGFLGGNDVPLLDMCTIEDADSDYMSASPTEISISHSNNTSASDDTGYVPRSYITDWANVELDSSILEGMVTEEGFYVNSGTTISEDDFTWSAPLAPYTGGDAWKADFVQLDDLAFDPTPSAITQDTVYTITATLSPKAAAQEAVARESMEAKSKAFRVPVSVSYKITKQLSHISVEADSEVIHHTDGTTTAVPAGDIYFPCEEDEDSYIVTIVPESGYDPPDLQDPEQFSIVGATADVQRDGNRMTIIINKESITDDIVITAAAKQIPHKVTYIYEVYDPFSKETRTVTEEDSGTYYNGSPIDTDSSKRNSLVPDMYPNGFDGYTWTWSDSKADNEAHTMGDTDIYVIGTYKPVTYYLLINYVDDGGSAIADTYLSPDTSSVNFENDTCDIALIKGASYSVMSPVIDGYSADQPFISGTVDDDFISNVGTFSYGGKTYQGKTVTVTYTPTSGAVFYRVKCDNHDLPETSELAADKAAALTAPTGYEADYFKITQYNASTNAETEIAAEAIGATGTYYVYYRKDLPKLKLTFAKNPPSDKTNADITIAGSDGTDGKEVYVIQGREYCFMGDSADGEFSYSGFPKAVCKTDSNSGYHFKGWYTAPEGGTLVDEESIVEGDSNITLYAQWESDTVEISVDYRYANNIADADKRGTESSPSVHLTYLYGMTYNIDSPAIANYTPDQENVTGVALVPDTNLVYYYDEESDPEADIEFTVNVFVENTSSKIYGGTFALFDDENEVSGSRIENETGVLKWNNIEILIEKDKTYTVKCIDPPAGYEAGTVEISSDDNVKNLYLGMRFKLPLAGGTPLTGFTVFGISTMLLAAFLLYLYTNKKAEDKNV